MFVREIIVMDKQINSTFWRDIQFFFPIATLQKSWKCNVIQQIKKSWPYIHLGLTFFWLWHMNECIARQDTLFQNSVLCDFWQKRSSYTQKFFILSTFLNIKMVSCAIFIDFASKLDVWKGTEYGGDSSMQIGLIYLLHTSGFTLDVIKFYHSATQWRLLMKITNELKK